MDVGCQVFYGYRRARYGGVRGIVHTPGKRAGSVLGQRAPYAHKGGGDHYQRSVHAFSPLSFNDKQRAHLHTGFWNQRPAARSHRRTDLAQPLRIGATIRENKDIRKGYTVFHRVRPVAVLRLAFQSGKGQNAQSGSRGSRCIPCRKPQQVLTSRFRHRTSVYLRPRRCGANFVRFWPARRFTEVNAVSSSSCMCAKST